MEFLAIFISFLVLAFENWEGRAWPTVIFTLGFYIGKGSLQHCQSIRDGLPMHFQKELPDGRF